MLNSVNYKEKVIAVVGVSTNKEKYGYKIFLGLLQNGYQVYGVNPKGEKLFGQKIYHNLKELSDELAKSGKEVDMVLLVVPPVISEKIIDECRDLGIKEVWFQPGSESESAFRNAEKHGMKVTANMCFMVHQGIW